MYERYCINPAYHHREEVPPFDDTPFKDEWQNEVYELAEMVLHVTCNKKILKKINVLDVGCGSAFKLLKYFRQYHLAGIELPETVTWLRKNYPGHLWIEKDQIGTCRQDPVDLMICSDVIEHVKDPDLFLEWMATFHFNYLVISTPDRSKLPEIQQLGPPVNQHHLREWTSIEFHRFAGQYFDVRYQKNLTEHNGEQQVLICRKK